MWQKLSRPWQGAFEQAWLAGRAGSVPIGAIITNAAGEIVACGRNHIFDPAPPGQVGLTSVAHAEINALLAFDAQSNDPTACVLYTTVEPCPQCMGAIYMAGIRTVRYASRDPYAGSTNMLGATPYLSRKPVRAYLNDNPPLEIIQAALVQAFDRRRWSAGQRHFILEEPFNAVLPASVTFARWLDEDGRLTTAWKAHDTPQAFFDWLAQALQTL